MTNKDQSAAHADRKLTGGQAVVDSLRCENIDTAFGLIGSAAMEIYDALYDAGDIRYLGVRDERAGIHMADGYARASGRPGIFLAGQNGPGATNLVTGLAQAKAAFSPVIAICGALSTQHVDRDAFQEVDQQSLLAPITKKTWTVTQGGRIPEIMRTAFSVALAPRRGPVAINLPRDILAAACEYPLLQSPASYRPQTRLRASEDQIQAAAKLLLTARQPVIVAGGGVKNAGRCDETLALAEQLNAPIATSPGHGDAIPFAHPLNAGQMGPRGNAVASELAQTADVILALGTRLGFNSTFYSYDHINSDARIIQVELDPISIGRYFPVAVGICADAAATAAQLHAAVSASGQRLQAEAWAERFHRRRAEFLRCRDETSLLAACPIMPAALFKSLRDALPKDCAFTFDAGTACLQATDQMNYALPRSQFTPLDFGLVGFSFACGLGVKLAMPERPVVSLIGDGGFGMALPELSTAVEHGIHTVTVVMNNQCWGAEKAYQRDFFERRFIGADITSPPFDQVARLYGAAGYKVDRVHEIADAAAAALAAEKPAVIDVAIDPDSICSFRRDSFSHRNR